MREVPVPMTTLSVVLGSVAVWCHTTRETKLAVNTVLYVCYLFLHLSFAKKKKKINCIIIVVIGAVHLLRLPKRKCLQTCRMHLVAILGVPTSKI